MLKTVSLATSLILMVAVWIGNSATSPAGGQALPAAPNAQARGAHSAPVVLELFTSQGCSSCPPADRFAEELAASRSDVIVISRPVTYWDRLGWVDTLAQPANTDLQRAYAARGLDGRNGVYTPQAVIDGRSGAVGSNRAHVNGLIRDRQRARRPQISVDADGKVRIAGSSSTRARLSLIAIGESTSVAIRRGENANRRINYTNVFLAEQSIGTWRGGEQEYAIPSRKPAQDRADRYLLLLREDERSAGPILAARWLS